MRRLGSGEREHAELVYIRGVLPRLADYPLLVLLVSLVVLSGSVAFGAGPLRRWVNPASDVGDDLRVFLAAALTLLALIIAFSYSMAISRYDERKDDEENEANAIGTEYARADVLPPAAAGKVRELLRSYTDERIRLYTTGDEPTRRQIDARTRQLQAEMWTVVANAAGKTLSPAEALAVSGMNDVLNTQSSTQASWWNRIPRAAWTLMTLIAVCCHLLIGFGVANARHEGPSLVVLPLLVSLSFFLIADIDSPRGGVIRVQPENLQSLAASLRPGDYAGGVQ
jgi:hypothetical protein